MKLNYKDFHSIQLNGKTFSRKTDFREVDIIDADTAFFLNYWFENTDFIQVETSGSTGNPKTIKLNKNHMLQSAKSTCDYLGLTESMNALLCLPTKYIGGKMMLVRAIYSGYNLITTSPSKNPLGDVNQEINFLAMTPYQFESTLEESIDRVKQEQIIILGGAPVTSGLRGNILGLSSRVFETFGMTETISHIGLKRISESEYFEVLAPTTIRVNKEKQLVINAPQIGVENLVTNDIVELQGENSFKWLGRKDFVINTGGVKVHPEELENRIGNQLKLSNENIFITSLSDERLGQKVVLCLLDTCGGVKLNFENLSKYERPKEVYFLSSFVCTNNGKIDRLKTQVKLIEICKNNVKNMEYGK